MGRTTDLNSLPFLPNLQYTAGIVENYPRRNRLVQFDVNTTTEIRRLYPW